MVWISISLFILGNLLIFVSIKGASFPFYIRLILFLLGIIMILLAFYLIRKSTKNDLKYVEKKNQERLRKIKSEGQKILVNLEQCEILTNKFYKRVQMSSSKNVQMYNSVFDSKQGVKDVKVSICNLKFKSNDIHHGKAFISEDIIIDINTLKVKMIIAKNTYLYINKSNSNEYHFDLSFLNY